MAHHSEASRKDCRVLITEDEYFLADDLVKALQSLGAYVIGPVPELPDAISVQRDDFDVAVIDINLRGYLVYPIADELMLMRIGKPFIFTTGYGADTIPHRFRQVQRFEKPYELENVIAAVTELCGRAIRPLLAV